MKWIKCFIEDTPSKWFQFQWAYPDEGAYIIVSSGNEMHLGEFRKHAYGGGFYLRVRYRKDNCLCQWEHWDKSLSVTDYWMPLPEKPNEMD